MNKLILVLYVMKTRKQIEVIFDDRLSFVENFYLLDELYNLNDLKNIYILDDNNIFLKKDIPIKEYEFKQFEKVYIF